MFFQTFYQQFAPAQSNGPFQRFLEVIIYPSVWVTVAIASLVFFVQDTLALAFDWRPALLIFSAALLPYNLDRVLDTFVQKIPDDRMQAFFRNPGVLLILVGATGSTAWLIYQANVMVRWVSLGGLVPLIYGLPLFPWRRAGTWRWYRIKDIPGAKAWLVCGSITYAVIALPLAYAQKPLNASAVVTALWVLTFVGSNSHSFDIRDIESDRESGVFTLPVLVGVRRTRLILTGLNAVAWGLLMWGWFVGLQVPTLAIALPSTLLTLTYVWTLTPQTPRQAYTIWVDGLLLVPAILTLLLNFADKMA